MWVCLLRSKTGQNKMETFEFVSAVRGYHIYKDIWEPSVGKKNSLHIKSLVTSSTNLLSKCSTVNKQRAIYCANTLTITLEVPGRRRHCKKTLWGNGNPMLCKVLLFEKSDHKPFKRPVNKEGLMARNVSFK